MLLQISEIINFLMHYFPALSKILEHRIILNFAISSIRDEYKEFEKLIQDDLQEVDNRFEEEEVI